MTINESCTLSRTTTTTKNFEEVKNFKIGDKKMVPALLRHLVVKNLRNTASTSASKHLLVKPLRQPGD
jgi:hypothetical protein